MRLNLGGRLDYIQTVGAAFSPRASVVFQPQPSTSFRFAYSRAYRPPTLIENYLFVPSAFNLDLGLGQPVSVPLARRGQRGTGHRAEATGSSLDTAQSWLAGTRFRRPSTMSSCDGEIQFGTSEFYGPADPPPGWPLAPEFVPVGVLPKTTTFRNVGQLRARGLELFARHRLVPAPCGAG